MAPTLDARSGQLLSDVPCQLLDLPRAGRIGALSITRLDEIRLFRRPTSPHRDGCSNGSLHPYGSDVCLEGPISSARPPGQTRVACMDVCLFERRRRLPLAVSMGRRHGSLERT